MKSNRNIFSGLIILAAFVALLSLLHAQEMALPVQLQPTQADSIVQLTAEAQGLERVSADQVPRSGTFWLVNAGPGGVTAPLPCPPQDLTLPIYQIAEGQYLVDATGGQASVSTRSANSTVAAALAAQADAVVNLISRIQEAEFTREFARAFGFEDEFDTSDPVSPMAPLYDPAGLWLEITSVSNGVSHFNLHNATNQVYAIWTTTNLLTGWQVETELWPTNSEMMPFTLPTLNRQNLFVRAQDWTGVTSNGNEAPEWWLWKYFRTVDLFDTQLDSTGKTLLLDYLFGFDPNLIQFSLQFTNDHVNASTATGTVTILGGVPAYMAVLVNDTNMMDASWQPYASSNVVMTLGSTNGIYNVQVGLRGLPADAQQTWIGTPLTLNKTGPELTITNPVSTTGSVPMIQIQGYADELLSSLTFDVSNASGVFTNQTGHLTDQFYDTSLLTFTTNYFQCYDVALTNGLNTITLHATDLAGNTTLTELSFTLDYFGDTTPPALTVVWPQNQTVVASSNFTLQAQVDDVSATVTASIVDTDGNTNTVAGLVERSGQVWISNLPLSNGTNSVNLTATDAAGNTNLTNISVIGNDTGLTVDSLTDNNPPNQSTVIVTGTINNPDDTVTVNGMVAYLNFVDENSVGYWEADGVTVNPTGVAVLNVEISDAGNHPLASQKSVQPQPAMVALMSYEYSHHFVSIGVGAGDGQGNRYYNWTYLSGGRSHGNESLAVEGENDFAYSWNDSIPAGLGAFAAFDHSAVYENDSAAGTFNNLSWNPFSGNYEGDYGTYSDHVRSKMMIVPPGQQAVGQTALYLVQAQVLDVDTGLQLAASAVRFLNQLAGTITEDVTNSDGSVWTEAVVSGASGAPVEVTPIAAGNFSFMGMKISKLVYFYVDSSGEPSSFHASAVEKLLQLQLSTNVFDNLPDGSSVQIKVDDIHPAPKKLGWDSAKQTYVNHVTWDLNGIPSSRASRFNLIQISDEKVEEAAARFTRNVSAQTWVNILAHEGIWGNAGNNNDCFDIPFFRTCTDGDISAGALNHPSYLFDQLIVIPSSRTTLRSEFGF